MALATSLASALVGRGATIMDCSICVAVITGFPATLAAWMMRFCQTGTRDGSISTPRSPRRSLGPGRSMSTASGEPCRIAALRTSAMLRS